MKKPIAAVAADVHYTTRTPEYRRETCPFNGVIEKKLKVPLDYCRLAQIPFVIAGDFFDRSREFIDLWHAREFFSANAFTEIDHQQVDVLVVRGQHDMFHHNPQDRATSFNMLMQTEGSTMYDLSGDLYRVHERFRFYGAGYGCEIPVPTDKTKQNVLIWHRGLWHRAPMYPGQSEGNIAAESVRLHELGYKIVFSGDNHKAFDAEVGGVRFYNLGAFTRDDVTLRDQRPRFCVLFDDGSVESVYVGEKDVFDLDRSDADKGREDTRDAFSEALAGGFDWSLTFKGNLEAVAKSGECGEAVLTERQKGMVQDVVNAI